MNSGKSETKSEALTVLVFKDNSAARAFKVPAPWITRLGLLAGAISALALLGVFLSAKYYLIARQAIRVSDPAYVKDLETEVSELRKNQTQIPPAIPVKPLTAEEAPRTSSSPTAAEIAAQGPAVTPPNTPSTPAQMPKTAAGQLAFIALPSAIQPPPAAADVPIAIYEPHVNWSGRTFKVQFFIQYVKEDKGNQQGRIVLLARGADMLLGYPSGVFNLSNNPALITPDRGEYFSVSRIREVHADFGPMKSNTALKEIEVFLFSNDGRLLVHQTLLPGERNEEKNGKDDEEDS